MGWYHCIWDYFGEFNDFERWVVWNRKGCMFGQWGFVGVGREEVCVWKKISEHF